jgi:hypothetical protein
MVPNIRGPDIVLRVDTQSVRLVEEPVTNAPDKSSVLIKFTQHWFHTLEQVDVAL